MAKFETRIIPTRIGDREVDLDKILFFPHGLIGFEEASEFVILEIKRDSPFFLLQSLSLPLLGLLVTDPFQFMRDFVFKADQRTRHLLHLADDADLSFLVTVSIPQGKPADASLNLSGPILLNYAERRGLQVPQTDLGAPSKLLLRSLAVEGGEE